MLVEKHLTMNWSPVPNLLGFFMLLSAHEMPVFEHFKDKRDRNQQDVKIADLHFVKSEYFSLIGSFGSRQRDTTLSGWKFQLNNMTAKELNGYSVMSHFFVIIGQCVCYNLITLYRSPDVWFFMQINFKVW